MWSCFAHFDVEGVSQHGQPSSFMDGLTRFAEAKMSGDRTHYPQSEHMTLSAADFYSGHNFKRICVLLIQCP